MFGNRLGWGIAGVLAVLMLWAVSLLNQLNTISRPSQGIVVVSQKVSLELPTHPELLEAIKLPADPLSVLPTMTEPGDAAPFYQRAIKAAADNPGVRAQQQDRPARLRTPLRPARRRGADRRDQTLGDEPVRRQSRRRD